MTCVGLQDNSIHEYVIRKAIEQFLLLHPQYHQVASTDDIPTEWVNGAVQYLANKRKQEKSCSIDKVVGEYIENRILLGGPDGIVEVCPCPI